MDISSLIYKSQQSSTISTFRNPFPRRPWLTDHGAAAAVSNSGIKGIIAGKTFFLYYNIFYINDFIFNICLVIFVTY